MKICSLFLLLSILLFSTIIQAKKLYKYKDSQGHWHYSDKPPKTEQEVEVRQLKAAKKRYIWLEKTGDKHNPEYFAINNYYGPVEIEAIFNQKQNVTSTPSLPSRFIVQPGQSATLFKVSGVNQQQSWQFSLQYSYMIGSPLATHDDHINYFPPFDKNSKHPISQAFGGEFSHTGIQNQYAVDIAMPVNTAVHAARSGIVMEVNNDFYKTGIIAAYKSRANSIRILHDDGSMAVYAHLALEKAQVYPGLKISAGQLIGYSGNTGYSTGPHLHFAIQINKGMQLASVPFKFIARDGVATEPVAQTWLQN